MKLMLRKLIRQSDVTELVIHPSRWDTAAVYEATTKFILNLQLQPSFASLKESRLAYNHNHLPQPSFSQICFSSKILAFHGAPFGNHCPSQ